MKRIFCLSLLAAALVLGMNSQTWARSKSVEVVVTNYTTAQPFSPIACVVHDPSLSLYELGAQANEAVELIAEEGDPAELQTLVTETAGLKMLVVGAGVAPGATDSVVVEMERRDVVSCLWMLVNTNDTFASIGSVERPRRRQAFQFDPIALDAGSEFNDELAANIPGQGGGGNNGMDTLDPILGSPGIGGVGDLEPMYDWRGPVAAVVVKRQ